MDKYPEFVGVVAVPLHCSRCAVVIPGGGGTIHGAGPYCTACVEFLLGMSIEDIMREPVEMVLLHR